MIKRLYRELLLREADGPGLVNWNQSGKAEPLILEGILRSAEFQPANRRLLLPFDENQNWFVCQGYNQPGISHHGINKFGLDLTTAADGVGPNGCGNGPNASTGKRVVAPGPGRVKQLGTDFVCVTFDVGGGSVLLGHLASRTTATRVATGDYLGVVKAPGSSNGNYAHIHMEAKSGADCAPDTGVPSSGTFRYSNSVDLPNLGSVVNQHRGTMLKR